MTCHLLKFLPKLEMFDCTWNIEFPSYFAGWHQYQKMVHGKHGIPTVSSALTPAVIVFIWVVLSTHLLFTLFGPYLCSVGLSEVMHEEQAHACACTMMHVWAGARAHTHTHTHTASTPLKF